MAEPCLAPIFAPRSFVECLLRRIAFILALPALIIFSWLPAVHCVLLRGLFELRFCRLGNRERIDLRFDPNQWIVEMQLSGEVIFEEPQGELRPHSTWTRAERSELTRLFWLARYEDDMGVPEMLADAAPSATGRAAGTAYSREAAWRVFLAHVAHSIAVENAGRVPWSVRTMTPVERMILFDSRSFFRPVRMLYEPQYGVDGPVTYGDPVRTFRFVRSLGAIGPDARSVDVLLLEWAHANMIHFSDRVNPANCLDHWGYDGYPPVAAVIAGTTRTSDGRFSHWSAGCWGLTGFFRAVLRTANIGVALQVGGGHAQPHFVREDLFLSHGDDPYNGLTRLTPPYPMSLLLISRAQHTAWYGPAVPPATATNNVGRRTVELAIDHVASDYLMRAHCSDVAAGRPHATSTVYDVFRPYYTVAELEARTLWERLAAAIAARGGCGSL